MQNHGYSKFSEKNSINNICISKGSSMYGSTRLHAHDFNELVFILSGSGIQNINDKEMIVTAGDVFVLKGNDIHGFKSQNNLSLFNIGYKKSLLGCYEEQLQILPGYYSLFLIDPVFREFSEFKSKLHLNPIDIHEVLTILSKIESEFKKNELGSGIMLLSYFLNIVTFVSRKYLPYDSINYTSHLTSIIKALDYIEKNFIEDISLKELSEIVNTPISTLLYSFKKLLNTTPINYLNTLRIKKASDLLLNSDMSITETAFASGFTDSNYFCRLFKKYFSITPSEFRKNNI